MRFPKITKSFEERGLHDAFEIGVVIKGIDGIVELIGGFFLLFIPPGAIQNIFLFFARHELIEDPKDLIANHIQNFVQSFSAHTSFYGWLFLVHGVVKVVIVAGLLKGKLWAYPAAVTAFSLFVAYQLYELVFGYSTLLVILTLIDLAVIALTMHEYRKVRAKRRRTA